jgi:L-asparagine transporter-like permease
MIAIGGIIGAGLFVGSSASIAAVGPAVIVSYLLAGLIVLLVMRMLTEMAVAIPGVQTFPDFARLGLGDWAGFMSGWLYWYFWVVVVAIEAIAGAAIIHLWLPMFDVWQIGIVLVAVLTGVNLLSTRSYGEFEFWFSSLKVAAILAFIVIAASYAFGLTSPSGPTFANLTIHDGFMPYGFLAVLAGVPSVIFALTGAEIATIAAAESSETEKTIARMSLTVAARILIFYVLSIALIVSVVPWPVVVAGTSPFATALSTMEVPGAATIMNIIVLVAVLSCLNSGLYVTSRVLFGLAARGEAPKNLVTLNRRQVPARAIVVGSLFSYAALAASVLSPQVVFSFLVNASGATMLVIYLLIAFAQLRLRDRLQREAPEQLTVKMWFHPWGAWLAISGMIGVLAAMAFSPARAAELAASLIVIFGVGISFVLHRKASRRERPSE